MEKGIPVLGLFPGGHAERAGVRVGDIILSVNGKEVSDFQEYAAAIKDRGASQVVVLSRNGEEMTVEMAIGNAGMPAGEQAN